MRHIAWIDGHVVEAAELRHDVPYVMQRIHTIRGKACNAYIHVVVMREAAEYMFAFASLITGADVERIISRLLESAYAPLDRSVPVVMRLNSRGELSFEVEEPTYGCGAYLRAKRLVGVEIEHFPPMPIMAQSSESVAIDVMTNHRVRSLGGDMALWVDSNGNLISHPWMPLFVYHKGAIFTPEEYTSVEYIVATKAIEEAGYSVYVRAIPGSALSIIDELFVVDVMGVTSLSMTRKHRLQSSVAIRVAQMMEP
jgi:hypothetical protein